MEKQIFEDIKSLVNIPSYTHDRMSVNQVNDYLAKRLKGLGFNIKKFQSKTSGDLLIASFGKDKPKILLSGHTDIVPCASFHQFHRAGARCTGSGIADMKGGLAVILAIADQLTKLKRLNGITCMFTPDEETGSQTFRNAQHAFYKTFDFAFVFEPGLEIRKDSWKRERWIVTKRKGVASFRLETKGDGGHAGNKMTNRNNAVEEMSRKVLALQKLTDVKHGVTTNVGTIRGGEATNVIAPFCEATLDVRTTTIKQYHQMTKKIELIVKQNTLNVTSNLHRVLSVPPMEENSNTRILLKYADHVMKPLRLKRVDTLRGGGSDGNQIAQYGVGVLDGLGPVGGAMHMAKEWVHTDSLAQSINLSTEIIKRLLPS